VNHDEQRGDKGSSFVITRERWSVVTLDTHGRCSSKPDSQLVQTTIDKRQFHSTKEDVDICSGPARVAFAQGLLSASSLSASVVVLRCP
jgi:hypothetical protein